SLVNFGIGHRNQPMVWIFQPTVPLIKHLTTEVALLLGCGETHAAPHLVEHGIRLQPCCRLLDPLSRERRCRKSEHFSQRVRIVICPAKIDNVTAGLPGLRVLEYLQHQVSKRLSTSMSEVGSIVVPGITAKPPGQVRSRAQRFSAWPISC